MRITTVKAAVKQTRERCLECHQVIEPGQGYRWIKFRYGGRRVLHTTCRTFKSSEMTNNPKLSTIYEAVDQAEQAISALQSGFTLDEAKEIMESLADSIEEVQSMYEESADSMEEGFGHETSASEEQRAQAEAAEDWASTVRDCLDSIEDFDDTPFDEQPAIDEFLESIEHDEEYALSEFDSIEDQAQFILMKQAEFVSEKEEEFNEKNDRESSWEEEVKSAMEDALAESPF
jgi:hypothetical protein